MDASAQQSTATVADYPHGRVPRELRQRQIVELAEQLFAERGYRGASMDELSRRAGVTKPVIYELFESKDGLFRVCVGRAVQGMADSVAAAVRAETAPEARLRAGSLAFLRFAAENRVAWDLLAMGGGGRFADQMETVRRSQAQLIRQLMEEMAAEDVDARELEAAAYAVNSAYEGAAHWMWEHPDVPVEQVADWIVDLLVPGLRRFT